MISRFVALFLLLTVLSSCSSNGLGKLEVNFYNDTGYTLQDLEVEGVIVGDLKAGKQSGYISFERLWFWDQMPEAQMHATINSGEDGQKEVNSYIGFCGTGMTERSTGKFAVRIMLNEYDSGSYLYLTE